MQDVYNLYFTPNGQFAIVVAEAYQRLDFYDPKTWQLVKSTHFPECAGINHMDFTVDGKTALASCEFANRMVVWDVATGSALRQFDLDVVQDGMPQDTRLVPDGSTFLVADMHANGVYVFDGQADPAHRLRARPAKGRTASTSAATAASPTSPTAARARSPCSTWPR